MVERRLAYAWSLHCTSYAFLIIVTAWRALHQPFAVYLCIKE
jgi:hypothetical protein